MSREDDFDRFVRDSSTSLLRTALLLAGDLSAAHDLLQTAYERTWRHWHTASAGDPTAYARRALANAATDSWRRRRRLARLPDRRAASFQNSDALAAIEVHDELITALLALPVRQRTVVVLRYWEDLSEAAVAEAMSCSVGTVKSQASRGLAALRIQFTEQSASTPPEGTAL